MMQRRGISPPINLAWENAEHQPDYSWTASRETGIKIGGDKKFRKILSYIMECPCATAGGHEVIK
jgi:hypothetical protein